MTKKNLFLLIVLLVLSSFCVQAQVGIYPLPLYSGSIHGGSNASARTASLALDPLDTLISLKLPYIEDFSGNSVPLDKITYVPINSTDFVYQLTHLKLHGLTSGAKINLFNVQDAGVIPSSKQKKVGIKYVKIIDPYTFQLFNDPVLVVPYLVGAVKMTRCDWTRVGDYGYSTYPDTLGFWPNNGGAYINDQIAVNPISAGVATFDGVNYMGIPYSTGRIVGYADNLTSHRFDLSSYTKNDSVYMSFYWQHKSLSDSPLTTEFFALEFNFANGDTTQWVEVWRQAGNPNDSIQDFRIAMVRINTIDSLLPNMNDSTKFIAFHKNFRYRFRSYGVLSGMFNVWNLDYIFIDKNRKPSKPTTGDLTIMSIDNSCLKNYTSVPYQHFTALSPPQQAAQLNDSSIVSIRVLSSPNETNIPTVYLSPRDNLSNLYDTLRQVYVLNGPSVPPIISLKFPVTIDASKMNAPYVFKQGYWIINYDTLRPYDLSFNNFKAIESTFYDYYAYDDGGAEFSLQTDESGLSLVNKYTVLKSDQLTDIDICFVRSSGPNLTGRSIYLQIWSINPLKLIGNQLIAVEYGNTTNQYVRYHLSQDANLAAGGTYSLAAGDYYIGYQQKFNDLLTVGYDRNNDHLDKIFLNSSGSVVWSPFSSRTSITGSLMIRPVFSKNETLTSVVPPATESKQFEIYPNPVRNELHFMGEPEHLTLYDITGKIMYENSILNTPSILLPESISSGLYIAVLSKGDITEIKRLIVQ